MKETFMQRGICVNTINCDLPIHIFFDLPVFCFFPGQVTNWARNDAHAVSLAGQISGELMVAGSPWLIQSSERLVDEENMHRKIVIELSKGETGCNPLRDCA